MHLAFTWTLTRTAFNSHLDFDVHSTIANALKSELHPEVDIDPIQP